MVELESANYEGILKRFLLNSLRRLDTIDQHLQGYSGHTERVILYKEIATFSTDQVALRQIISKCPRFGEGYGDDFRHDIAPYPIAIDTVINQDSKMQFLDSCPVVVVAVRHILESVRQEFGVKLHRVDLGVISQEIVACSAAVRRILPPTNNRRVTVTSELDPKTVSVRSQQDILFRLINNLVSNAENHATEKVIISAEEDDKFVRLVIEDDGEGFGKFFEQAGIEADQDEVSLESVVKNGNGVFYNEKEHGRYRRGLRAAQFLAVKIGAKVFIRNPKLTHGARVSIVLPKA